MQTLPIMIDTGSYSCLVGFCEEGSVPSTCSSIVGRRKIVPREPDGAQDIYIGDEARENADILALKRPIDHGDVTSWDDLTKLWTYMITKQMGVELISHPILMSRFLPAAKGDDRCAEVMFETMGAPSLLLVDPPCLALYTVSRTSGVVVDCGFESTRITPVSMGSVVSDSARRIDIGGADLDAYMLRILNHRYNVKDPVVARSVKEKCCYVARDFDSDVAKAQSSGLIDMTRSCDNAGKTILTVSTERFRCPELLFKPRFDGLEVDSLDRAVFNSVESCDDTIRADICKGIIVCGGSALFKGIGDRLESELAKLSPTNCPRVITGDDQTVWKGGAILASIPSFDTMIMSKSAYQTAGRYDVSAKSA